MYVYFRHPISASRPTFSEVATWLSYPDPELLKWSESDKSVHPEATKLGANILCGGRLYPDLQSQYKTLKLSVSDDYASVA